MKLKIKNIVLKNYKSILIFLVAIVLLISWLKTISPKSIKVEQESYKLGTIVRLTLYGADREKLERVMENAMSEISRYEGLFSVNIRTSEISKINSGEQSIVSEETVRIITDSLKYAEDTNGAFDPTIGAIVKLWGIGTESARLPEKIEVDALLPYVGYKKVCLTKDMVIIGENQSLDLGGIAKGWIADRLAENIKKEGISSALIDLGGNIAVVGKAPQNRAWRLGLQHPKSPRGRYFAVIDAIDTSVVTSGPYERYFEENGVIYHHIFDPSSGHPSNSDLESVTIISKNSAEADALCTAFFIMGEKKSIEFLNLHKNIQAVLVVKNCERAIITERLKKSFTIKDPAIRVDVIGEKDETR
ncbi:MAG: FAD:protein FMN transferase [Synergistaceae bacterium]|nr:FAD:protein FMN transferase [Synergistaceae bacterium]